MLDRAVALGGLVAEIVRFVDQHQIGVGPRCRLEALPPQLLLREHARGDGGRLKLPLPHFAQAGRAHDQRLLAHVVGIIFEQLLADPGFPQPDRIGDQHAVVAGQNLAGLLDRVFLEFGKLDGRTCSLRRFVPKFVLEVLVERLHVDLERRVLPATELGGVEQLDQLVLEFARVDPLPFVPSLEVDDRPRANLALEQLAVFLRDAFARARVAEPCDGARGVGVFDLLGIDQDFVGQVELAIRRKAGGGEIRRADDRQDRSEAVEQHLLAGPVGIEQPALRVQEALVVEPHPHRVAAQKGDEIFDQPQRPLIERKRFQVAADERLEGGRVRPKTDLLARGGFGAEQEPEIAQAGKAVLDDAEALHREVRGRGVKRAPLMLAQQRAQHISQPMGLVVDYVGDAHSGRPTVPGLPDRGKSRVPEIR